ncbi:hypothetical protein DL96DRAFT_1677266 [Flagelloscypha sp. PMI_526]|nr:hypothetical protein DL96DRAFT_1677266 [Flagelloscypha sp. PMI_526]
MGILQCPHCSGTLTVQDFVATTAPPPIVPEELLQSNQLLIGFNSNLIHNNIEATASYLKSVETVLTRVDLLRNGLEEARRRTRKQIVQQRECIGIGRGLPLDVLRNIFEMVTDMYPYKEDFEAYRSLAIIRLASVSRTWRRVSLELPSVWSYITIPFFYTSQALADTAQLLDLFLIRSGDSPLHVSFYFPDNDVEDDENIWSGYKHLFLNLADHSSRWEELILNNIPYELLDTLFPLSGVSRLKSFEIEDVERGVLLPESLILNTPALRSVHLAGLEVKQFGPRTIPWSQLRKLELEFLGRPFQEILALLTDFADLEDLTLFQMDHNMIMNGSSNTAVELTNLIRFSLSFTDPFILDALTIPNLRHFIFARSWQDFSSPSIDALGPFLMRTKSLETVNLSSPFYIPAFPGTHHTYRLVIVLACNSPVTLERSGVASLSYACLIAHFPRLRDLEVICEEDGDEKEGDLDGLVDVAKALVTICRARNEADGKSVPETFLENISARFVVGTSPVVFEKLLEVRKEAMEFPRFTRFQVLKERE